LDEVRRQIGEGQLESLLARREFMDGLGTGLLLLDADGTVVDCNTAGATQLGGQNLDVLGRSIYDFSWVDLRHDGSPFSVDRHPAAITLRTGESCVDVILGIDSPSQARRWLSIETQPLDSNNRIGGVLCACADVTQRVQQRSALELLTEFNRSNPFGTNDTDPFQHLCDALVNHGRYPLAWVGFASEDVEGRVDIACSSGPGNYRVEDISSWSLKLGEGPNLIETAIRSGSIQIANEYGRDSPNDQEREWAIQSGLSSVIAIPFQPGQRRAVLTVYSRQVFAFDDATVQGLEAIAKKFEFGVLHGQSLKQLESALDGTISALGHMTETRDPYTAGHQVHVGTLGASLAEAIAIQYGLDARMVELIRQSGDVHDIGKIAVPSEILTKPGRLTPLEYEMVKRHTTVGHEILSRARLPWPIAEVALQHHERLDGSGYPLGITAQHIILPARVIAVADVVEAMTQDRPYRPGLGLDQALNEVTSGAGTLYDAEVVRACLAVFDLGFIFQPIPARGSWAID
jgi:HD-GYP domain-containing protein (c-di-GMP phosphodiesterase class II)